MYICYFAGDKRSVFTGCDQFKPVLKFPSRPLNKSESGCNQKLTHEYEFVVTTQQKIDSQLVKTSKIHAKAFLWSRRYYETIRIIAHFLKDMFHDRLFQQRSSRAFFSVFPSNRLLNSHFSLTVAWKRDVIQGGRESTNQWREFIHSSQSEATIISFFSTMMQH